jgi:hypothetical protein
MEVYKIARRSPVAARRMVKTRRKLRGSGDDPALDSFATASAMAGLLEVRRSWLQFPPGRSKPAESS